MKLPYGRIGRGRCGKCVRLVLLGRGAVLHVSSCPAAQVRHRTSAATLRAQAGSWPGRSDQNAVHQVCNRVFVAGNRQACNCLSFCHAKCTFGFGAHVACAFGLHSCEA
jgi:hypothetical protein